MRNDKASIHHEKKEELWLKSNEKLRDWSLITRRGGGTNIWESRVSKTVAPSIPLQRG